MADLLSVSDAARELKVLMDREIRPQDISMLFYRRLLRDDSFPIVGGRRLILRDQLLTLRDALERHQAVTRSHTPTET